MSSDSDLETNRCTDVISRDLYNSSMDAFENYWKIADLDNNGKISRIEGVVFFSGFGLSSEVVSQIWMYADHDKSDFLDRPEFFNALRLVTVAQSGRALTPDIVKYTIYGLEAAEIPAPQMKPVEPTPAPQVTPSPAMHQTNPFATTPYMGAQSPPQVTPSPAMHQTNPFATTQYMGAQSPPQALGTTQGLVGGSTVPGPRPAITSGTTELSVAWLGNNTGWAQPWPSIASEEAYNNYDFLPLNRDDNFKVTSFPKPRLGSQGPMPPLEQGNIEDIYTTLQVALADAAKYRFELNEEICKRQKTEMHLVSLIQKVEESKNALLKELDLSKSRVDLLQEENKKLQEERNNLVKEVKELRDGVGLGSYEAFSKFSMSELQWATENFNNSHKIGEGGFGCVYKGFLHNTMVAIKMLHPESLQGKAEFEQEVAILSTMRHPNLVTLIGACSEQLALVYEFLPNGSLEDRLVCLGGSPPLTWQVRTRIIGEICRALLFLYSNNPNPIVHGDLNPSNILLDANLVSKLSDFGISRLLIESNKNTLVYRTKNPKGTFAYMDPEFLRNGQITIKSDVYSFGIIILRLLTGKPPLNIIADMEDAVQTDSLHLIIDESAGEWPFVQAKQLTNLGLRCTQMHRKKRPNLDCEWKLVESLMMAASLSVSPSFKSQFDDKGIPSYFMCPIFQEIMKDPHIAADGYTYEAEAIKGWLHGEHKTSPMTNLPLDHLELTPNHALRSAIQEWLQQHS